MRPLAIMFIAAVTLLTGTWRAEAAGHHEITVIPIGSARVTSGTQDASYRLPANSEGTVPQPVVFIAAQPWVTGAPMPPLAADEEEEQKQQVPATIRFTVADRKLPAWELRPQPTAYVINVDTVKTSPDYAKARLALTVDVTTTADTANLMLLGMPDPRLLDTSTNGPLADLAQASTDADVQAYFLALATEIAGDKEAAQQEYDKLRTSKNDRVGRFARRGLRMLSYDLRKRKLSGNYMEHYRWGLYLRQCGLFAAAFKEFEECRIIFPRHRDGQFHAGEMYDHIGGPLNRVLDYMDRTGEAAGITNPTRWYALVVILKSRGGKTLTNDEILQIKNHWLAVEKMVWAASDGAMQIITSFYDVENTQQQAYMMRDDGMFAPTGDLVEVRGWFDGVISVAPRLPDEADAPNRTVGADVGLNGAALSCLFAGASWSEYMAAWYHQLTWAARTGEVGRGYPIGAQAIGCGHRPAPHSGYAYRAALRYAFTQAMFRRLKMNDVPMSGDHVQLWKIEGPYPVKESSPAAGLPSHHVLDVIPAGPAPRTEHIVSNENFIDLAKLFPNAGRARAQATCWVYSPKRQDVRMWLGQNDGMAVWLNGKCIHQGRYYSAGQYEDKNLVDTIASYAGLREGWNELRVVVESWPAPRNKGWGFSVRLCTWDNAPILGIAYVNRRPEHDVVPPYSPPEAGVYYSWKNVQYNYHDALPMLDPLDLENITGVKGLRIAGAINKSEGHVAVRAPGQPKSRTYRALAKPWQNGKDRDVVLNNVFDWAREACAAYRYQKDGKAHDLLLLKPEAFEAYLTLLDEPESAVGLFGGRTPEERILGYLLVPAGMSDQTLLVIDTLLSDEGDAEKAAWPVDEEDILTPFGENIPNADFEQAGPQLP